MMKLDPADPLYDAEMPKANRQRIVRSLEAYAKIPLPQLASRRWDDVFPPLTRLYLYLQIRTLEGQHPVHLTNVAVLDIGLSRGQKSRLLRRLEELGAVEVERSDGCAPLVYWQTL